MVVLTSRLAKPSENMASEEGTTHTRTIQKRAKKTQDQACQFDASLLEGNSSGDLLSRDCSSQLFSRIGKLKAEETHFNILLFQRKQPRVKVVHLFHGM